jgi:hypothetical protein
MNRFALRDVLGWGVALWLFGYVLGFVFYGSVPLPMIGWYIMPFGIAATCLVLWRWVHPADWITALMLGIGWSVIAIVLDYFGIVKLLAPPDGYYKLDVYLYYLLTLLLPLGAFWLRATRAAAR